MPTPSEQKALLFLGAVAVLGGAVRLFGSGAPVVEPTAAERAGLAAQAAAAESAAAAVRAERSGGRTRRPGSKRKGPASGGETDSGGVGDPASPGSGLIRRPLAPPVDIDRATTEQLDALPGIGPALAARIVADRQQHGPFGSLDALDGVSGIGPTLINRLAGHVTFSGPRRPVNAPSSGGGVRASGRIVGINGERP